MMKSIEFGKMMREEVFTAVRTELNSEDSFGVTLVCKDGEPVRASARVFTTWSPVIRQLLSGSLENATIFLPQFSAVTATKVMEMLSMRWEKEGETNITREMIDLLACIGINPGKVEARKVIPEEEEVHFVCDLCDETMADVETHMSTEHGDIDLAPSEMKGFCRPTPKVGNIKKEKESESNMINWANIKIEPTVFVDFNKGKGEQGEDNKGKIKIKGTRVKKVQRRKKKSELKSMSRCHVKLSSCKDLIRKLTKGNDGNTAQDKGNDGNNIIGGNVDEKSLNSGLATIEDQLLEMQDISEDEDDLLAHCESASMSVGDISD